jgi:hypothetical protein
MQRVLALFALKKETQVEQNICSTLDSPPRGGSCTVKISSSASSRLGTEIITTQISSTYTT